MRPKKAHASDLENKRFSFLLIGFIIASSFSLVAFEYTTVKENILPEPDKKYVFEGDIDIPQTFFDKREVKEVPKPVTETKQLSDKMDVVDNKTESEEGKVVEEKMPDLDFDQFEKGWEKVDGENYEPVPFAGLEIMPSLPGCEGITDPMQAKACIQNELAGGLDFDFPKRAKEAGLSGIILLTFVIDENGNVTDIKAEKSSNEMFEAAAIEGLKKSAPTFNPGIQNGKKVKVPMSMAVRFSLK